MLDVKAVGANLTPEQQEATLADLNFFLDEFGSTRAVRVKLQEQQRDIQRLGGQVRRLVNGRGEDEHDKRDDEITVESNQSDPNGVDEIMADVDFFLRAYGSTRAVRHELYAQRQKLANLQSTIRYFQKRQGLNENNVETGGSRGTKARDLGENDDKVGSTSAATLVQKVSKNEQQNKDGVANKYPQGVKSSTFRHRASHVTCKVVGCMKWVMRDGDLNEYCVHHRTAFASTDDCPMQDEKVKKNLGSKAENGRESGAAEKTEREKRDVVLKEAQNGKAEKEQHVDADCCVRPFSTHEDISVSGLIAAYYKQLKSALTVDSKPSGVNSIGNSDSCDVTKSQPQLKDSSMVIKQAENVDDGKADVHTSASEASSLRPSSRTCRHQGCTKNSQAHGLCWAHGGYYICKVDGCTLRAISRKLCRNHGGGTRCRFSDCDKMIFSYGKGYCYRHARDQGIEVNRTSKAIARYRPQVSEGDANGIEADERRPQNFEKARQDFDETSSSTSTATCKPHHVTCKAFRCMKWVMRVGEYCSIHRASRGSKHDNSRTSTPDLATSILQEHKMKSTDASTVGLIKWKGSSDNTTRCRGVPR
ncbi:hypothetical protein AM587_10013148 [Phytophthora nicotianae]|uniref:WRKY19-like zinc finger domain-containing protein n=1 Tax=Phytophthora nicotianae TaxID=4792 RepID=A0A0W8D091_PHYNI|nr:hypothetical protein AM587_10013148 [Phytophthora nicotianae]